MKKNGIGSKKPRGKGTKSVDRLNGLSAVESGGTGNGVNSVFLPRTENGKYNDLTLRFYDINLINKELTKNVKLLKKKNCILKHEKNDIDFKYNLRGNYIKKINKENMELNRLNYMLTIKNNKLKRVNNKLKKINKSLKKHLLSLFESDDSSSENSSSETY